MFNQYISKLANTQVQQQPSWDHYIEKQLAHLVVQLEFDFVQVAKELSIICESLGKKSVTQSDCQKKWTYIHKRRLLPQQCLDDQRRMERVQKCFESFEDPAKHMNLNELIARLPKTRKNQDFLVNPKDQFNVLKDSVRIKKDKQKEAAFLEQLDQIAAQEDKDQPYLYNAQFDEEGRLIVEKQNLDKDKVQKLLSQRVDTTQGLPPQTNLQPELDENFVSVFAPKKEEQLQPQDDENLNIKLIQDGILTVEEAVKELEQLEQQFQGDEKVQDEEELPERPLDFDVYKVQQQEQFKEQIQQKISQLAPKEQSSSGEDSYEDDFLESQRAQIKHDKNSQKYSDDNSRKHRRKEKKQNNQKDSKEIKVGFKQIETSSLQKEDNQDQEEEISLEKQLFFKPPEVDAAIRFRQQLVMEQKRREEQQRLRDQQQIEELEKKIQTDQEYREKLKREVKQRQIEEQMVQLALLKKNEDEKEKQAILMRIDQYEQDHEQRNQQKIETKNQEIVKLFENSYFNPIVSYLTPVFGIPKDIAAKIDDLTQYETTRDGITNRYQILVFPYIQDINFIQEFLTFFLINSTIRTYFEFNLENIPSMNRSGFPFCLVSYFIGSVDETMLENDELFIPQYIKKSLNLKKGIYMFFDTHITRGSKIMQKKIESIYLANILSPKTLKRIPNQKLSDFAVKHLRRMDELPRCFYKLHTFHSLKQRDIEQNILIIREYSEKFIINEANDLSEYYTNTSTVAMIQSSIINEDLFSRADTRFLQQTSMTIESNLNYLLKQLDKHNIEILGMRTVYLDETNIAELQQNVEYIKLQPNKSVIVIAIQSPDVLQSIKNLKQFFIEIEKIIGSEDPQLARNTLPQSVNALYHERKENSIIYPRNKTTMMKLISYFFAGRLRKVTSIEQVKKLEGLIQEQIKYFICPIKTPTLFLLDSTEIEDYFILVSPQIGISNYSKFLKTLIKRGYKLNKVFTIPSKVFCQKIEEQKQQYGNFKFQATNLPEKSNLLWIHCSGHSLKKIRKDFLIKHLNYNFMMHPSKKELIYYSHEEPILKDVNIQNDPNEFYTQNKEFKNYLAVFHKNSRYLGESTNLLIKKGFELLGIFCGSQKIQDVVRQNFYKSLKLSQTLRRKTEPATFCDRVFSLFQIEQTQLVFFRFQEQNPEKIFQSLHKDHLFPEIDEQFILRFGSKQVELSLLQNQLEFLFFELGTIKEFPFDLCDDVTLKDSFIFDIPPSITSVQSFVLLDESFVKSLSFGGIIKKFETSEFEILSLIIDKVTEQLEEHILSVLQNKLFYVTTSVEELEMVGEIEKTKQEMIKRFASNRFLIMIVKSNENGIFNCKNIIKDFVVKYAFLSKEEISKEKQLQFQLSHGVYCSTDYKMAEIESTLVESISHKNRISLDESQIYPVKLNKMMLMIETEVIVGDKVFHELIQGLQDEQIKIDEISHFKVSKQILLQYNCIFDALKDKYKIEHLVIINYFYLIEKLSKQNGQ